MYHDSVVTVAALIIATFLGIVSGLQKVAFKKGATGKSFGDSCLRSYAQAVWVIDDKKNFTSDQIWTCPGQPCVINKRSGINKFYENPPGGNSILLKLIPAVEKIHANLYTCQEQHWTDEGSEFPYQVSVYDQLSCSDNVNEHKAGEAIEFECGITAWGDGEADLEFQILSAAGVIESTLESTTKSNTEISSKMVLDKTHHGKKIACNLTGFDGEPATTPLDPCIVNDVALNILYPPTWTKKLDAFRFAKEGDAAALDCAADANPPASIKYFENGATKIGGNSVILTDRVKTVSCSANNSLGSVTSDMNVNFLKFEPVFPADSKMNAKSQYAVNCGLRESNAFTETPVRAELTIGEELISTPEVTAKKEWNEKKVVCVAKETDRSRSDGELLRKEIATLDVLYEPEITCSDQTATADYSERECYLEQNPLSPADQVVYSPDTATIEWGGRGAFRQDFTLKMKRKILAEIEDREQIVSISVSGKTIDVKLNYTNTTRADIPLIVGLAVGLFILAVVFGLLIIFLRRVGICVCPCAPKKSLTDSEKGDSNFPSDDGHGQPPANRSMNGYDNKIAPNDDGLVYADLAFSDHQPRSRAPIIDPYSTTDYADIDFGPHPPPYSISDSVG